MTATTKFPADLAVGDVIQDSYANPAVIVKIAMRGTRHQRYTIMQTVGSDRGNLTYTPLYYVPITDPARVEWARGVAREIAKAHGWRWNQDGLVAS